jgi:hypothetical protein
MLAGADMDALGKLLVAVILIGAAFVNLRSTVLA